MNNTCPHCHQAIPPAEEQAFRYCPHCGMKLPLYAQAHDARGDNSAVIQSEDLDAAEPLFNQAPAEESGGSDSQTQQNAAPVERRSMKQSRASENAGFYAPPESSFAADHSRRRGVILSFIAGVLSAGLLVIALTII
jgi:hypothetical protein